ncbi:MAG: HAMP domain-containing sensor histidine kinase [Proteobacteria bacterium]|nr:HAMP domain-containing sensor histidine kinase [Pseudomonadota bacterium]
MPARKLSLPPLYRSLSARLLVLTIAFVMLAEVLIYAPSIGRFRKVYLEERIAAAHIATLALEAAPDHKIGKTLEAELLAHAGAYSIELSSEGSAKELMLGVAMPPKLDAEFDLRQGSFTGFLANAFEVLAMTGNRVIRVRGVSPKDPGTMVEIVIDEAPMRMAMIDYSERILALSILISMITAALVYLSLQLLIVYPMRRVSESIMQFRENPEDPETAMPESNRTDEIGVVQRALADMEEGVRTSLRQKARLAALGAAVTKINHDLRNILATAHLLTDRLAMVDDPEVRRIAPTLVGTIDKAAQLCAQTLDFARAEKAPVRAGFDLYELVEEVGEQIGLRMAGACLCENAVPKGSVLDADREQMFRVLANLAGNAAEAGAARVRVSARMDGKGWVIEVRDDGAGLPPKARERLFRPFEGSARPGGTGLGLAIARELMRAHGGDIVLQETGPEGTSFLLLLPAMSAAAE